MPKRLLLCPPTYFDVVDQKNPYMSGNSPVDRAKALRQWQAVCDALRESGCEVETLDATPGLEDMVFAANQAFVGYKQGVGKFVVPSRMAHDSRQREVPFYVDWYRTRGYKVIDLNLGQGDYLEGHGDLIWHPDGSRIFAGYGFRSTRGAVESFSAAMSKMEIPVTPLQLVDPFCYHLDTCFCPLNDSAVLIYPGAYSTDALDKLSGFFSRVHHLTAEEAYQFMANGIVANGRYLTPHLTPHLDTILSGEGLTPVLVDTSEFEKAGGSVFCMKTVLP